MQLSDANLELTRAAWLITLGEGLTAVGRLRTGKMSGQFSLHNFRLRAAYESSAPAAGAAAGEAPLVILLRAGVFRRHTWFMRVHPRVTGKALRLELAGPIDADWDWWTPLTEIHDRLATPPLWKEAVGVSFEQRVQEWASALVDAAVLPMDGPGPAPDGAFKSGC